MKLKISALMDEYQDNEVFPTGGSAADIQVVKERVLACAVPANKKFVFRRKKLTIAALAAVMVLLMGAGYLERTYHLASSTITFSERTGSRSIGIKTDTDPLELEDERLFLVLDGERTDITDLIDKNTPYIINLSNPEEDMVSYLILGGTSEYYGWFQWFTVPDPYSADPDYVSIANEDGIVYGYDFSFIRATDAHYKVGGMGTSNPDWRIFSDFSEDAGIHISDFQWLKAAADQLSIPFTDSTGELVTTIHN